MEKRTYTSGHFELVVEGHSVGRFETLFAATAPGSPPRSLQPQELFQLLFQQGSAGHRTLVLKKGRGDAMTLRRWSANTIPRELVIAVLGPTGQPVAHYRLQNAWPVKWYAPSAAPGSGEVAIEEIVIAHEGFSHG